MYWLLLQPNGIIFSTLGDKGRVNFLKTTAINPAYAFGPQAFDNKAEGKLNASDMIR